MWENTDGAIHDFAIRDSNGETLVQSDPINEGGRPRPSNSRQAKIWQHICVRITLKQWLGTLRLPRVMERLTPAERTTKSKNRSRIPEDDQEQESDSEEDEAESTDDSEGPTMADDACPDDSKGDKGKGK